MNVSVRGVDEAVFRNFRSEVVRRGLTVGEVVNELLSKWLSAKKTNTKKFSLLELEPVDLGKGSEKLSSQVDEILYGGKI